MQCPRCNGDLRKHTYEGVSVRSCVDCQGYLVKLAKLEAIKRRDRESEIRLATDAHLFESDQQKSRVRCPQCKAEMRSTAHRKPVKFATDHCQGCRAIWFDPGELALLQIAFQNSALGVDAKRFRERLRSMTDEGRAEYEKSLANLPDHRHGAGDVALFMSWCLLRTSLHSSYGFSIWPE